MAAPKYVKPQRDCPECGSPLVTDGKAVFCGVLGCLYGMTPVMVLRRAIDASGLSARSFAALLEVDERTVRRWLAGDREIPGPVRVVARAIFRDPGCVTDLTP